jgi:hypothetical protein
MARAQEAAGYRVRPATARRGWFARRLQVRQLSGSESARLERLERIAERQRNRTADPRDLIVRQRWF